MTTLLFGLSFSTSRKEELLLIPEPSLIALSNPTLRCHRFVLANPKNHRIIAERQAGAWQLPRVITPRWTRTADRVQAAMTNLIDCRAVLLDVVENDESSDLVLAEAQPGPRLSTQPATFRWIDWTKLPAQELLEHERVLLDRLFSIGRTGRGRFSRFGWLEEVQAWLSQLTDAGAKDLDDIDQFNASAKSQLIRFNRRGEPPLWLKSVDDPLKSEFEITKTLASYTPRYLPRVLAAREDWRAWCMEDAGMPLGKCLSERSLLQAVECLAELQKASTSFIAPLLFSGCQDQSTETLTSHIPQTLDLIAEAMEQSVNSPRRLSGERIHEIGVLLREACLRLQDLGIPDTLLHGDVSLDNILVGPRGCVFTDWASAGIGNPFITFEQLRVQIEQESIAQSWECEMTRAYLRVWSDRLSNYQIRQAQLLIRPIAVFAHLVHQLNSNIGNPPHPRARPFMRGMATQIDRTLKDLAACEMICA